MRLGDGPDVARQAVGIEDHDHGPVAQDGGAGIAGDVADARRHRLDHDLLGLQHAVDHHAEGEPAHLADHDEGLVPGRRRGGADAERAAEVDKRQELLAQPQHRGAVDMLDAGLGAAARPDEFDHRDLGQREALAGALDDQSGCDGEGERDLDVDRGALAGGGLDVDQAAHPFDVGAHHVHADAAAGDVGQLLGGREAGVEDQLGGLLVADALGVRLAQQAERLGLAPDPLQVEAAAVVGDRQGDVAPLLRRRDPDAAARRLARLDALRRLLDAVVGGVADHVQQRVLDQLQELAVDLGLSAGHLELDVLAQLLAEVADEARQLGPGVADGLHARLHDAFLQLGRDM